MEQGDEIKNSKKSKIDEAANKKGKSIFIALIICCLLIGVPLFIDWIIIGNSFPSNINNSDWVGFFGGYIGAIMSGGISLVGIYWTIRFTHEENRADREMSIRPAFDIYAHHLSEVKENWLGYVLAIIKDGDIEDYRSGVVYVRIKNVGVGPALNIDIRPSIQGANCEYSVYFQNNNEMVTTNALMSGEQAGLTIEIRNCKKTPKRQEYQQINRNHDASELMKILPPKFQLDIELVYKDLLGNWFNQKMSFKVCYMLNTDEKTDDTSIRCDIDMIEIGAAIKYLMKP